MPKLYLGEALGLLGKTLPFLGIRLGSYLLLGLGLAIYFGIVGGVAWMLGQLWAPLGFLLFLVAIGGGFGIVRLATRYWFYLLKAGHAAVMTEFIVHGRAPQGNQVAYGRRQVTDRFRDTSVMFGVDGLVDGVVRAVTRSVVRIADVLPVPGLESLAQLLRRVAMMASTYVDEAILSRAYAKREQNVWRVAHEGVVLYAQAWKPIVANAVVLALIGYAEFFLLLIVLGLPAIALNAVLPIPGWFFGVSVVLGAWMIKLAVADAFSMAATLLAYHRTTAAMEPDPEWTSRLEDMSEKFRELGRKAADAARVPVGADDRADGDAADGDARPAGAPAAGGTPAATGAGARTDAPTDDARPEPALGGAAAAATGAAPAADPAVPPGDASDGDGSGRIG